MRIGADGIQNLLFKRLLLPAQFDGAIRWRRNAPSRPSASSRASGALMRAS
jgi:hypothetical protein